MCQDIAIEEIFAVTEGQNVFFIIEHSLWKDI